MVSVTMTAVAKEAGPRRPSTSRNEGWREAHPSSGCSFLEFSCQAVKYGPPLGSEHLGAIFEKKSPGLKRPLGVLPVFWNSQERLTRNIFRKYFSPKYYSGNISQKSAPRQIFRAQIFLGQQIFSQQIFGGVAVTSKHVG